MLYLCASLVDEERGMELCPCAKTVWVSLAGVRGRDQNLRFIVFRTGRWDLY